MRFVIYILFLALVNIVVTPVALLIPCAPVPVCEAGSCCVSEEKVICLPEGLECCPAGVCNFAQCVFCCFAGTISDDKIVVRIFGSGNYSFSVEDQFLLSGFKSDCRQPPEIS